MEARYPSVSVRFSVDGESWEQVALADTGCDAELVLPRALLPVLPPPGRLAQVTTASGESLAAPAYDGMLELSDQPGSFEAVFIVLGEEYLLGLPALNHFRITLDHGQRLIIEP